MCMKGSTSHTYMNCILAKCQRSHLMCSAIQMYIMCVFLWKMLFAYACWFYCRPRGILWLKNSSLPVDLIVLSCKSVQINYNAVFNTLSSWALSVWQFSLFWYMYTDLVTIASLSSKSSLCIDSAKFANAD